MKAFEKLLNKYDQEVLQSEIDSNELRENLLKGLKKILHESDFTFIGPRPVYGKGINYEAIIGKGPKAEAILDEEINIEDIVGNRKYVRTRLLQAFSVRKIKTYRDLIISVKDNYGRSKEYHRGKLRDIMLARNVGETTLMALYKHLNRVGIKIFGDNYTPVELGE